VTGASTGATSGLDYATIAYNAATGARQWASRYNGPANKDDAASALAVSPRGHFVFVTGASTGATSGLDYATIAYNAATGARQWASRYDNGANGDDVADAVAVGPRGGTVYITGYGTYIPNGVHVTPIEDLTIAYGAATGARRWVSRYQGPGGSDGASSLAVGPGGGTVYVSGSTYQGVSTGVDYATIAYKG
jgi:hypothetical protein